LLLLWIESTLTSSNCAEKSAEAGTSWICQMRASAVGHAARVVEIEQHRWTLRDCFEQVAEFSKRVRSNDVALVLDEVVRFGRSLRRVYVEVIEPEIGHHFFELAITRYRTSNALRLQLTHELPAFHTDLLNRLFIVGGYLRGV